MIIASQKKKENIAEYLLYMWQIEDLIRAYGLDIDRIQQQIIDPYDISPEQKKAMREWYESLIDMMHAEGVEQKGHLQLNKNVLIDLTDLHLRLLKSPREPFYGAAFFKTLPYIQARHPEGHPANIVVPLAPGRKIQAGQGGRTETRKRLKNRYEP